MEPSDPTAFPGDGGNYLADNAFSVSGDLDVFCTSNLDDWNLAPNAAKRWPGSSMWVRMLIGDEGPRYFISQDAKTWEPCTRERIAELLTN